MQGNGLFAWTLSKIAETHNPVQLASLLSMAKVRWVSWKVSDGIYRWNQIGGNDKLLIEYMQALEAVGIRSGGWSYCYPEKPGTQAGIMAERVAKFSQHVAFDHLMIDIEKEWKKTNLGQAIDTLLYMDISKNFPVGFCSYRYPSLHSEINYSRFLKHETIKFNAPQVYWIDSHNPGVQLARSFNEYAVITDKPFVPMGAAFGYGNWEPTIADLKEFVATCITRRWYTYGWWSLDYILKHNRIDWLEAIAGIDIEPPVEPPIDPPVGEPVKPLYRVKVAADVLNVRGGPNGTDLGELLKNSVVPVVSENGDWVRIDGYVHRKYLQKVG